MTIDPNLLARPAPKIKERYAEAKQRARKSGKTVYEEYVDLQSEQLEDSPDWRVRHAPPAKYDESGRPLRVSRSLSFPYGVDEEGGVLAPYGISDVTKRPIIDKVDSLFKNEANGRAVVKKVDSAKVRGTILETLERVGCDPILIMAEIAMDTKENTGLRLRAATELAQYIYPKKRSVEHTGDAAKQQVFVIAVPGGAEPKTTEDWLKDVTPKDKIIDQ